MQELIQQWKQRMLHSRGCGKLEYNLFNFMWPCSVRFNSKSCILNKILSGNVLIEIVLFACCRPWSFRICKEQCFCLSALSLSLRLLFHLPKFDMCLSFVTPTMTSSNTIWMKTNVNFDEWIRWSLLVLY